MNVPVLEAVRCTSCRRRIGWAQSREALKVKVYCDSMCAAELPITPNEARNDQWETLRAFGWSPVLIAKRFGVVHSQVYKALDRSNPRKAAKG